MYKADASHLTPAQLDWVRDVTYDHAFHIIACDANGIPGETTHDDGRTADWIDALTEINRVMKGG